MGPTERVFAGPSFRVATFSCSFLWDLHEGVVTATMEDAAPRMRPITFMGQKNRSSFVSLHVHSSQIEAISVMGKNFVFASDVPPVAIGVFCGRLAASA